MIFRSMRPLITTRLLDGLSLSLRLRFGLLDSHLMEITLLSFPFRAHGEIGVIASCPDRLNSWFTVTDGERVARGFDA